MKDDSELLQAYVRHGAESAFTELVERHKGLVYASALRQTRDAGLAEEITQAVFLVLARKAAMLKPGCVLSGWLFRATSFAVADAVKIERRRRLREQAVMAMSDDQTTPPEEEERAWHEVAPVLDETLSALGSTDRDALLLRFFEQKSLVDVGRGLGLTKEAARKRVDRALDKLRRLLGKRGVTISAALLASLLAANGAPAAPITLSLGTAAAASGVPPLVKGILTLMAWSQKKIALLVVGTLVLTGGTMWVSLSLVNGYRTARDNGPPPAAPAATAGNEVPEEMTLTRFEEPPPAPDGFIPLFNGRDLSGWNYNPHVWSVTNGIVTGRIPPQASRGVHYLAWAGGNVDDFELRLSVRSLSQANTGVPFRARWAQQRWFPGYQAEIDGERSGRLVIAGPGRVRALCRDGWRTVAREDNGQDLLQVAEAVAKPEEIAEARAAVVNGAWCDLIVIAEGPRVRIQVNGVTITDTRDEHPTKFVSRGALGLEYQHREGVADGVEFRDIRFKRLGVR